MVSSRPEEVEACLRRFTLDRVYVRNGYTAAAWDGGLVGIRVGMTGAGVVTAPTAPEPYSTAWVLPSATPVWARPFFFWNALTAPAVPLPKMPSRLPV